MKYVFDKEELNEHIFSKLTYWLKASSQLDDIIVNRGRCADDITESFLKSKTPVEEIAEGKVRFKNFNGDKLYCIGAMAVEALMPELKGKNIKIYIEVIK